jgi:NitT/TauT family transport system permease protein
MMQRNLLRIIYPLIGAAIIVLIWHYYVVLMRVPVVVLPTPLQVAESIVSQRAILAGETWVTALECVYGFLLSLAIGIPIAVVMTYSRVANLMFYPLLVASQSIPKVAIAPILLVWFGTGIESKLAMAFVIAFFPIVVDTVTGLRSTSPDLLELARSLQASRLQTFFKIQLPSAMPSMFSGAKIAVTLAVIGAVIGEFIGSNEGLGNLLLTANSQLNSPLVWASLVVLSVLGMALYGAVVLAEKILMPWAQDTDHKH